MYLILIFLPLFGSILAGIFGRKLGVIGSQIITTSFVVITTFLSFLAFFEVGFYNNPVLLSLFTWIDSESLNIKLSFYFDSLTISMLIPVLIVSSLVHIYSIGYMKGDPHNQRFFSYLSLFTFMMIILVTSNNLLLMFVGWEGVGVCSYLLVNFWFTRIAANQSSISAFLTNRVGDCFLTIGMFAILWSFGNIDYPTIFSLSPYINENIITLIGICLLIGAMAKSSQFGLHVWLPMAMEGPTPVSALIHAATMVTAGVYLLMRTSPLIEYSSTVLLLCLLLGAVTTVFSSLIGLFQQDIKKVIAYSTMSQLGMMVIAVGLSSYNIALFHLINHAFYKALLFLGAGSVIHAVSDNQDFRKFGGLKSFLPLTYSVMLIASLSLMAFPFMTGFYSKDFILESTFGTFSFSGTIVYCIATIAAMFTTLYSIKVLYLTFLTNPNGSLVNHNRAHEGDIFLTIPLIILALFSIFFGFICKDIFIGIGSDFFSDNALFIHSSNEILLDTEFAVNTLYKLLPLILTISLSVLFIIISEFLPKQILIFKFSNLGYSIFSLLNQRFFIELFYNKYITNLVLNLGGQTTKILDKGSIEYFGPFGLEKSLTNLSRNLFTFDAKSVVFYALYFIFSTMMFISLDYFAWYNINYLLIIFLSAFISISVVYKDSTNNKNMSNFKIIESKFNNFKIIIFILALLLAIDMLTFNYTSIIGNYLSIILKYLNVFYIKFTFFFSDVLIPLTKYYLIDIVLNLWIPFVISYSYVIFIFLMKIVINIVWFITMAIKGCFIEIFGVLFNYIILILIIWFSYLVGLEIFMALNMPRWFWGLSIESKADMKYSLYEEHRVEYNDFLNMIMGRVSLFLILISITFYLTVILYIICLSLYFIMSNIEYTDILKQFVFQQYNGEFNENLLSNEFIEGYLLGTPITIDGGFNNEIDINTTSYMMAGGSDNNGEPNIGSIDTFQGKRVNLTNQRINPWPAAGDMEFYMYKKFPHLLTDEHKHNLVAHRNNPIAMRDYIEKNIIHKPLDYQGGNIVRSYNPEFNKLVNYNDYIYGPLWPNKDKITLLDPVYKKGVNVFLTYNKPTHEIAFIKKFSNNSLPRSKDVHGWSVFLESNWDRAIDTNINTASTDTSTVESITEMVMDDDRILKTRGQNKKQHLLDLIKKHHDPNATKSSIITEIMINDLKGADWDIDSSEDMPKKRRTRYSEWPREKAINNK